MRKLYRSSGFWSLLLFSLAGLLLHPLWAPLSSTLSLSGSSPVGFTSPEGVSYLASNSSGPAAWECGAKIGVGFNPGPLSGSAATLLRNDLHSVLAELSSVSGLTLAFVGDTDEVPDSRWSKEWAARAPGMPVVVAVIPKSASDLAIVDAAASGGGFVKSDFFGRLRVSSGFVLLHAENFHDYRPGSGFMSHQALLLHELMHVLNVAHSEDPTSIMTPSLADSYGRLGSSDLAALDSLSTSACS